MASLTVTAFYTRRAINWAILVLIVYIILKLSWGIFATIWEMFFPPAPIPANHAFGKLSAIKFPKATPSGELQYRLETIEGYVPPASESALVYFMPKASPSLLGLTDAKTFAKQMEFSEEPAQETKYSVLFTDSQVPLRQLRYDIVSKNFSLTYDYQKDPTLFTEKDVPLAQSALGDAQGILKSYQTYPDDIAAGKNTIQFLKYVGDSLVLTTSQSQAEALEINFFRGPIADTQIFYPNPDKGPIRFIYSGSLSSKKKILEFTYNYWPIDHATTATYALKTSTEAWQELQSGAGFIARYPKGKPAEIVIRKVYLGYYDSMDAQTYLQPIFVFEGDDGFLAYVPAVASPWAEQ